MLNISLFIVPDFPVHKLVMVASLKFLPHQPGLFAEGTDAKLPFLPRDPCRRRVPRSQPFCCSDQRRPNKVQADHHKWQRKLYLLLADNHLLSKPNMLVRYAPAECPETKISLGSPPYFSILLNTQATAVAASSRYLVILQE